MHFSIHAVWVGRSASGFMLVLVAALAMGVVNRSDAAGVKWGYSGDTGPEHWGKNFTLCGMGKNQSPIDIVESRALDISALVTDKQTIGARPAGFLTIKPDYREVPLRIINNGHAVEVIYDTGSTMTVHGRTRQLKQFHFHSPSENRIDGESFPMEAHLVHADDKNNLTVIAILFKEGKAHPFIDRLWAHMPQQVGKEVVVADELINATDLLPGNRQYHFYNGSLTTPPCSEGVVWLVLQEPLEVSKEQLDTFRATMGFANNRPVQPVNSRVILTW